MYITLIMHYIVCDGYARNVSICIVGARKASNMEIRLGLVRVPWLHVNIAPVPYTHELVPQLERCRREFLCQRLP